MLRNSIICLLFILPNIAFSSSARCSDIPLSNFLMHEDNVIVSFTVTDCQLSQQAGTHFIKIEITTAFYSTKLNNSRLKIET